MLSYTDAMLLVTTSIAVFMLVINILNRKGQTNKEHAETIAASTRTQESILELKEVMIEVRGDIKSLAEKDHVIDLKLRDIENSVKDLERRVAIVEGKG